MSKREFVKRMKEELPTSLHGNHYRSHISRCTNTKVAAVRSE